jgi:iron complex outermembrane receptor protein
LGHVNYSIDASHFQTDGYRVHGSAERNLFNSKVRVEPTDDSAITVVVNAVETPFVDDPLGLTRAQWQADPTQAGAGALQYDTRKSLDQEQAGVAYRTALGARAEFAVTVYGGHRQTVQFQAIPAATEARPTNPGGVIDLDRGYGGIDGHFTVHPLAEVAALTATVGASYDRLDEVRRGYLNFVGTDFGIRGALRRDQNNEVYDFDQYGQLEWSPDARWHAHAGVRFSTVDFHSNDHLATPPGPAETGVRYSAVNPVAGISFEAAAWAAIYGSYGRGFETPTLNDLAYRSTDGSIPGLNTALRPARSDNYEVGAKLGTPALMATLAGFYIETTDELAVAANASGRSVAQNIGETRRHGAELEVAGWEGPWSGRVAYTYVEAVTVTPYSTCVTLPCVPTPIPVGNRLPAVPAHTIYTALRWEPPSHGYVLAAEALGRAKIYVDDRNSDAAPAYVTANLRISARQATAHARWLETLRIDNVADRRYVGSVIVNETSGRFFEPDPGRTVYLVVQADYR